MSRSAIESPRWNMSASAYISDMVVERPATEMQRYVRLPAFTRRSFGSFTALPACAIQMWCANLAQVQETMQAILDTLKERHMAWQDAYNLALERPHEYDLAREDGPQYLRPDASAYDTVSRLARLSFPTLANNT